jgi:uncharacterized membrane protein
MSEAAPEKETGRVEAFSDGVFAIAITLLILDIRVPRPPEDPHAPFDLGRELLALWPSLLAYFMSFAIILVMWVNHHRIFTLVRKVDQAFLFWNGLLLMFVTFVPFPTALLAEYMRDGTFGEFRLAAIVYAGHGLLIALTFFALWRYATAGDRLIVPGYREDERRLMMAQYRWGPVSYLLAFGLAFLSPWSSVVFCLTMALFFAFRGFAGIR